MEGLGKRTNRRRENSQGSFVDAKSQPRCSPHPRCLSIIPSLEDPINQLSVTTRASGGHGTVTMGKGPYGGGSGLAFGFQIPQSLLLLCFEHRQWLKYAAATSLSSPVASLVGATRQCNRGPIPRAISTLSNRYRVKQAPFAVLLIAGFLLSLGQSVTFLPTWKNRVSIIRLGTPRLAELIPRAETGTSKWPRC